jgi:hypothetical protein
VGAAVRQTRLESFAGTEDDVLDLFTVSHDFLKQLQIVAELLRWRFIEAGALTKLPRLGSNCLHPRGSATTSAPTLPRQAAKDWQATSKR